MKRSIVVVALASVFSVASAEPKVAEPITVEMYFATEQGQGDLAGTIVISENKYGALFTPDLKGIEPGIHGFHVHAIGDCGPSEKDGVITPAGAAGGHWDPDGTDEHLGPWEDGGHKGDLPALYADVDGTVTYPVLAPKIKDINELKGLSLMVHVGGDNHSDHPKPLGGGGPRLTCGVIK